MLPPVFNLCANCFSVLFNPLCVCFKTLYLSELSELSPHSFIESCVGVREAGPEAGGGLAFGPMGESLERANAWATVQLDPPHT